MAKTKIEKIAGIEEKMAQLEAQRKKLIQENKAQEKRNRTNRLCRRAGLLESMLPETITLTDEQFKIFLEKSVANEYGRSTLARIAAQTIATATAKPADTAQGGGMTAPTIAEATQSHGGSVGAYGGNAARVTG